MSGIGSGHIIGVVLTLLVVVVVSIYSGKDVKSNQEFLTGGGKTGAAAAAGAMLSVFVGGAATLGTAQLAFQYGFSALWFAFGVSGSCVLYAVVFGKAIRNSKRTTIQEIIRDEFGEKAAAVSSIVGILSINLSTTAQLLSAIALLGGTLSVSPVVAGYISVALILSMVILGGAGSAGVVGSIRSVLVSFAAIGGGALVLYLTRGLTIYSAVLPQEQYFNFFARGVWVDVGGGVAIMIGAIGTQAYVPFLLMGKDHRTMQRSLWISAFAILPIGLGGVLVGMYMRW